MHGLLRAVVLSTAILLPYPLRADEPETKSDSNAEVKPDAGKPLVKISGGGTGKLETAVEKALEVAAPNGKANVPEEARALLDQVRDAYAKLKSLELAGTISANYLIGSEKQISGDTFTATFESPLRFRHEMKDDMLIGSTGEKVYAFQGSQNVYTFKDAPKARVAVKELPDPLNKIIQLQNPSLACALSKDASEQLIGDAVSVKKLPDAEIEGEAFRVLAVSGPSSETTYTIDPKTFLLRRVLVDQRAYLQKLGQTDVKQAQLTFDYSRAAVDAPVKDGTFAWSPPAGARDMVALASAGGGGAEENPAAKLEGNSAPDFKLMDLAGKEVSLSALKGSVVVVDFWATWCGPCVQSLPHLNQLYEDKKAAGLKVVAVSVDEDKAKVPTFVTDKKLSFTVVIDTEEAKVAEKFAVNGIPQTVVVGKDGKVRKVFVGFGPGSEEKLRAEVEAAMK